MGKESVTADQTVTRGGLRPKVQPGCLPREARFF